MLIRAMEKEDIYDVLSVAESAFFDEKLYKWTVPDNNERGAFIKKFFQFRLEMGLGKKFMEVAVDDSKQIAGAVIWNPPEENENNDTGKPSNDKGTLSVFDKLFSEFDNGVGERGRKFISTVIKAENHFIQPYWVLAPVFVHKKMQGKGIASLLIRKHLQTIDAKHLPCVLVTQEENNIPIYERYGFKTGIEVPIDTGLVSYGMIRE